MRFIKPQHPKSTVLPDPYAIRRVLSRGWVGQPKINGARLQMHISSNGEVACYTRQGSLHTVKMPEFLIEHLLVGFKIKGGVTVIDCEWERFKDRIHLFDILKVGGSSTEKQTYKERYDMLKVLFDHLSSMNVFLLPLFLTRKQCLNYINQDDESIEGLVFKAFDTKGWPDTAIIRCRK